MDTGFFMLSIGAGHTWPNHEAISQTDTASRANYIRWKIHGTGKLSLIKPLN